MAVAREPQEGSQFGLEAAPGRSRFSLGLKFLLVLILSLSAMVAGSSSVFYSLAVRQLEMEIDKRGASLTTALASLGAAHWNAAVEGGKANQLLYAFIQQGSLRGEVFNILLHPEDRTAMVAQALPLGKKVGIQGGVEGAYGADPAIRVRRGCEFVEENGSVTPARVFEMPVPPAPAGAGPNSVTSVKLIMNAAEISRARATLRNSVLATTAVAIALGALIALWLASFVTGPLKLLMKDIRAVGAGDLEHRTRPHSKDEIGELAETFNHLTVMMRVAREADLERQSIEHDIELARDIQSNLLPKRIPKIRGMDIQAFYRAAKEVGGDYYDLIPLTAQHLGIAVGDVAGKGVQGSLVMAMTRAVIRAVAPGMTSAAKTLVRANHILAKDLKPGSFVTLCYLVVDVVGRTLTVGRAGHNPLLLHHGETHKTEMLSPGGIALGFDPGPIFERTIRETTVPLVRGDVVVAYTDGVVESMNAAREQYGPERFKGLIETHAHTGADAIVKALVQDLDRHQGEAPQHDDITIVVMKVL